MISLRGLKPKIFASIMAIIAIVVGAYITFFESTGFVKTQATIVSIEEDFEGSTSDNTSHIVMVDYVADGTRYTSRLDSYSGTWKEGKTITVYYDPQNPSVVHGGKGGGIYCMVLGVAILAVVVVVGNKNKKEQAELEEMKAKRGGAAYAPSVKGIDREVYFLTDTGTMKYGHRIESKDRKVLYEAKMTKFSMATAYHFDFIDHEHGTTTPHLVGHEEESQWDTLLIDNHYTFELDGVDVWKHLKQNGVSVDTSFTAGEATAIGKKYRILRDGTEIAQAVQTSQYVHEEDAEQHKIAGAIPIQGFYRVWTREQNLDLIFMTLMAFARSGASDDRGGNYGAVLGTLKNRNK